VAITVTNADLRSGGLPNAFTFVSPTSDYDSDGVQNGTDCAIADAALWAVPTPARSVSVAAGGVIGWQAPAAPGGTAVSYDVLRSSSPVGFGASGTADCLVTGTAATSFTDSSIPPSVYYYVIVSRNGCGRNGGADSSGSPRTVRSCP
jgi:hypothetical protein